MMAPAREALTCASLNGAVQGIGFSILTGARNGGTGLGRAVRLRKTERMAAVAADELRITCP
jgi:hypothetical protein